MGRDPHPFYVPPSGISPEGAVLFPPEEAHHLLRVVRLRSGQRCRVVDGAGGTYTVLLRRRGDQLEGEILERSVETRPPVCLELGFPILRLRTRTEWLLEKAVEVGVDALVPITWTRGLHGYRETIRERWERIVREAMKQCERSWLPELGAPEGPDEPAAGSRSILADPEGDEAIPNLAGISRVRLLVGPEGGVTAEERARLLARGAALWCLGPRRLRAETAGIVGTDRLARALRRPGSD